MKHIIEENELYNIKSVNFNEGRKLGYSDAMDLVIGILEGRKGLGYNTLSPKNEKALNLLLKARESLDKK